MVERLIWDQEATGSSPVTQTFYAVNGMPLIMTVVSGSIPGTATILIK
jgi:hypothetical protein